MYCWLIHSLFVCIWCCCMKRLTFSRFCEQNVWFSCTFFRIWKGTGSHLCLALRWQKQSSGPNGVLCSVCRDVAEKFNKENYWLWLSSFFFSFFSPLTPWWGRCALLQTWEWVKSGPRGPVRDDISWLYGSKTNTQTCLGASALHLPSSCWTEVIQLCPSTFVFVYPYCRQSLI